MTSRDHALFAGGALACLALAVFQVWYVALPLDRAAGIDYCRWTPALDCFETLHTNGGALLPVLAALAALFLFEAALAGLAAGGEPPRCEAWLVLGRLASFPASGLAVYVLLADWLDGRKTSPSAVLIGAISIAMNVHAVFKGRLGVRVRDGGLAPVALAAACALFGFFLEGAAGDAREAASLQAAVDTAPPSVLVPDFEPQIPRQGAVSLGEASAAHEILLFLDPEQEESRSLQREAADLKAEDVILQIYSRPLPERVVARAKITEYPTAIWKGGRKSGAFTLAEILAAARSK